ncbi:MAG: type IV pilus assembly protein PilM [Candidatus Saccharibacteria bacterium]|jgi:type IV pilus assembly protein pilM
MKFLKGVGDFFALDIGTNAIRVVQLAKSGGGMWNLKYYGYVPADAKNTMSDSEEGRRQLGSKIMTAIGQSGIKTKNVVIGLPSSKTFSTVIDVPAVTPQELKATINYQMDQYIPIGVDDAKVDWKSLGQSLHNPEKQEVLISSTSEKYAEDRLEFIESLGLNVIAAEPDPIAMIRSILPVGLPDARLIIDVGEQASDVVITFGDMPRLVRSIPFGISTLVKTVSANLSVSEDQSRQFIFKFGLAEDKLEGQILNSLKMTLDNFAGEISKSLQFFKTRYPNATVGGIFIAGSASTIPQMDAFLAGSTGIQVTSADPWLKVKMTEQARQQIAPVAAEFATVVGLAERNSD